MRSRNALVLIPRLLVAFLAMLLVPRESFGALGDVWHIPNNAEPSGVPSMRNPKTLITPFSAVTNYNGSYTFDGNQSGGSLIC